MCAMPYVRQRMNFDIADLPEALRVAVGLFSRGKRLEAFDLFEMMLETWPEAHVEILATCHDCYQSMEDRSRYALYQSRTFDFPISEGDRVLDIGSGHIPFPMATHLADISLSDGSVGRGGESFKRRDGLPVYECPVEHMPFEDNAFDFVYCSHVLEHAGDPDRACRELMRIAKKGYIETPSPGKDTFLNSAGVSNHRWAVENIHGKLVFTEYGREDLEGMKSNILMDMHVAPRTPREKAFSALIYLRAARVNTMYMWEGEFAYEVRRRPCTVELLTDNVRPLRNAFSTNIPEGVTKVGEGVVVVSEAPPVVPQDEETTTTQENLRLAQVHTFYPAYLDWFYKRCPLLGKASYEAQMQALVDDGFSGIHMLAPHLGELGYNAELIIANNPYTQFRWMYDRGLPVPEQGWMYDIVVRQLEEAKPDVLYLTEPIHFSASLLQRLSFSPRLVLGWRAADIPANTDWSGFDVMLSSLAGIREEAVRLGAATGEDFSPGFPEFLARRSSADAATKETDVVFCGQWTIGQHQRRNEQLLAIARASRDTNKGFSCAFHLSGDLNTLPPEVEACSKDPLYGRAMHRAIASGRIAFDGRGTIGIARDGQVKDLAGRESANMRIFEATGSGSFLLTEHFDNLSRYFDVGREIETYSSYRELIDKVRYYLAHPEEREAIARRGQKRCLTEHSMQAKAKLFDSIVRRHLKEKGAEAASAPTVSRERIKPRTEIDGLDAILERLESSFETMRGVLAGMDGNSVVSRKVVTAHVLPFLKSVLHVSLQLIAAGKFAEALRLTSRAKMLRVPVQELDHLRAQAFVGLQDGPSAVEALKEELRYFPKNVEAQKLLERLQGMGFGKVQGRYEKEFAEILSVIKSYTMVPEARLYSLYTLARRVCEEDVPGNFVECGVAAGGSSALLATVISRYSKRERKLYSFDTFEGMPEPTGEDAHHGVHAEETGWGTGTCAAPEASLLDVCRKLGVENIVQPVKGFFGETLPEMREEMGEIAFLHMDGDWYESTRDILVNLYDSVHPDGIVQADDYGFWQGCSKAMHEFEAERGIRLVLQSIDNDGVWFTKPERREAAQGAS